MALKNIKWTLICVIFLFKNGISQAQTGAKSNAKAILSFQEGPKDVPIDEANKKITFQVPPFVDLTKLVPTIKVSDKATLSPASGIAQDFTKPVIYTVTAEDGSTVTYTALGAKGEGMPGGGMPSQGSASSVKPDVSQPYDLIFKDKQYVTKTLVYEGQTFTVRAYENIVYVANPVDTAYQQLNIYIPEAYYEGKNMNGYTAETAPIFFPNRVGGYMPAKPASTTDRAMGPPPNPNAPAQPAKPLTIVVALSKGYVVASAGARGRTLKDKNGVFTGKAPAGLVDLKAAIRYLKFNDKRMLGDAKKIISNGTSAGGAMSSLIGATGNSPDYEPYLKALGAAPSTDDVFAVSAYCPIINLEHSDMAYEWQFNGINAYKKRSGPPSPSSPPPTLSELNDAEIKVSKQLKEMFPTYLNGLKLKDTQGNSLTLDNEGNGNFKDLVTSYILASAQKALDKGVDLSKHTFLKIQNGKVLSVDFANYLLYMERMKTPPAFDALDYSTPETQLFGSSTMDKRHFTNFSVQQTASDASTLADQQQIKMMNPLNYIGDKTANTSKNWRVRHGAKDKDTGLAIPVILALTLQNKGFKVDFAMPWDIPHSGDYDLTELFEWIDSVCKTGKF